MRNQILLIFMLGVALPGRAEEPLLELGQPHVREGWVEVDVTLSGFFQEGSLESLEAGVPATLVFRWVVYREREGWRDAEVARGEVRNRIYFDVLEESYHLFDHQGRPLGACDALEGLTEALCRREAMVLERVPSLESGALYYLEMEASLKAVGHQEIKGIENWLRGEEDATETASKGLGGLTLGLIKKMAGLNGSTVQGVSPEFRSD